MRIDAFFFDGTLTGNDYIVRFIGAFRCVGARIRFARENKIIKRFGRNRPSCGMTSRHIFIIPGVRF